MRIPDFDAVRGYRATLKRFMGYMLRLFELRLTEPTLPCQRCGQSVPIQFELPQSMPVYPDLGRNGVYILCPHCGSTSHADVYGLALNMPAGQRFWQANPRMRVLPALEVESAGQSALLLRFESLASSAALDITLSRDRYAPLDTSSTETSP